MKVVIVGAGLIGAAIARRLSRRGVDITIVSDHAATATAASFGWINASFYADDAHHHLRAESLAAYGRMLADLPDAPIKMSGALWWEEQGAGLTSMKASLDALAYPVEQVSGAQARVLEPAVSQFPADVLRFPSEGACEADALAQSLVAASDAKIVRGVKVSAISTQGGAVTGIDTSIGRIAADHVIVAAGTGAPPILASAGVKLPMLTRPGVIVTTKATDVRINHVLVTPQGEVRQLPDRRIMASAVANHQGDDAEDVVDPPQEIAERVMAWLNPMIGEGALEWGEVSVGYRPMPQDELPAIGPVGPVGLHVAVMHSGVTLAAIVAEAIGAQIMGEQDHSALIAPYSPARFQ